MTQKKKLYVGNLNYGTTEDDLREHFSGAGEVTSVKIPQDSASGRSRGFGFVEMDTPEGAAAAIEQFDNSELSGRKIFVSEAREKSSSPRR